MSPDFSKKSKVNVVPYTGPPIRLGNIVNCTPESIAGAHVVRSSGHVAEGQVLIVDLGVDLLLGNDFLLT